MNTQHARLALVLTIASVMSTTPRHLRAVEPPSHPNTLRTWDFEKDKPGAIADGFVASSGRWEVVEVQNNHVLEDRLAPVATTDAKNQALAQRAMNPDDAFNLALLDGPRLKDVDLFVKLLPTLGEVDRGGGLVWRASDDKNYYLARYNPLEDNFRLFKVVNSKRTQIRSVKVPGTDTWHTLRVTMVGAHIRCELDNKSVLEADDATYSDGGQVGLWTKSDAQTAFDDLSVAEVEAAP